MVRALIILACAALCLTACGSGGHKAAVTTTTACVSPKAVAKLHADIAAMRRAAALPTKNTLDGNPAINHATDKFLNDVELAHITNLKRNRMIDHAAGTLAGACEQCFQALEAARPIPSLRMGATC